MNDFWFGLMPCSVLLSLAWLVVFGVMIVVSRVKCPGEGCDSGQVWTELAGRTQWQTCPKCGGTGGRYIGWPLGLGWIAVVVAALTILFIGFENTRATVDSARNDALQIKRVEGWKVFRLDVRPGREPRMVVGIPAPGKDLVYFDANGDYAKIGQGECMTFVYQDLPIPGLSEPTRVPQDYLHPYKVPCPPE